MQRITELLKKEDINPFGVDDTVRFKEEFQEGWGNNCLYISSTL